MALAYPGDVSAMSQMMARDYFLAALHESKLKLKISESDSSEMLPILGQASMSCA